MEYVGDGNLAEVVSVYFRAPELMRAHRFGPANIYFPLHHKHAGYLINWDRGESWTYHIKLKPGERWDVDARQRIIDLLGCDCHSRVDTAVAAHALTARWPRPRGGHLFSPTGGFGMNACQTRWT